MSFLSSLDIPGSALTTQRFRMDLISENIANMNTTRTASGEPYRRRYTIVQEREATPFAQTLDAASSKYQFGKAAVGRGVRVSSVEEDQNPFNVTHDPTHPDADENGYVRMPNVDIVTEMVDMMDAYRSYEANVTSMGAIKDMAMKALNIGQ